MTDLRMGGRTVVGAVLTLSLWLSIAGQSAPAVEGVECQGLANASAAVRVGANRILVGADENNALLLYDATTGGAPLKVFQTSQWLGLPTGRGEVDLEGAARVGDVLYWIGSHARNKNGKRRPERQRLMGLRVSQEEGDVQLTPVAGPVSTLMEQLTAAPGLRPFDLAAAAELSPEAPGGLNIEGLAATAEGGLWIGFRSPVPDAQALLVPLLNPAEVLNQKPARWGDPARVDLGGKGIRDLVWTGREYFILAGSPDDGGRTKLMRWGGAGQAAVPIKVPGLKDLNPEALVVFGTPEKPRLLILSDDGNRKSNETRDLSRRTFRMVWVNLDGGG